MLRRCSNLRDLYIKDWVPFKTPGLITLIESLPSSLAQFGFDLQMTGDELKSSNEDLLSPAFKHLTIETLVVSVQEGPESPLKNTMLPTSDTITRLVLKDAYLEIGTLRKILTAVPRLRHLDVSLLRYFNRTSNHVSSHLDFEALGNALGSCSSKLESLKFAIKYDKLGMYSFQFPEGGGRSFSWGPFGSFPSLRAFENLKSLEVPPEALLGGWHCETSLTLCDLLPTSLESLHLRWDLGIWAGIPGRLSTVCKQMEKYLMTSRGSRLKALTLTCFDFEVEYAEPEFASLNSLCQRLGIAVTLETVEDGRRDRLAWAGILSQEYGRVIKATEIQITHDMINDLISYDDIWW